MKTFNELLFWLHLDHFSIYVSKGKKETKLTRNYEHNLKSRTNCMYMYRKNDKTVMQVDIKLVFQNDFAHYYVTEIEY